LLDDAIPYSQSLVMWTGIPESRRVGIPTFYTKVFTEPVPKTLCVPLSHKFNFVQRKLYSTTIVFYCT